MEHFSFIRTFKRSGWIALLAFLIVLAATVWFTHKQKPIYQASTTLMVGPSDQIQKLEDILRGLDTLDRRSIIATYARIPETQSVREKAREQLKMTDEQMKLNFVRTSVVPDTNVLQVTVDGLDPQVVADVANAIAEQSKNNFRDFYGIFGLKVLDPATVPSRPVRPDIKRNLTTGAVLGLLLGVALVLGIEYFARFRQSPPLAAIARER